MDRPKLDKPRLELWKTDDKTLSKFLGLAKKSLNVNNWEFHVPADNKMVTYHSFAENIQERYPSFAYVEAMRNSFLRLPDHMRIISNELFAVFKRFTISFQERLNFAEEQEKYIKHLEKEIKRLPGKPQPAPAQVQDTEAIDLLKAEVEGLRSEIGKLKGDDLIEEDIQAYRDKKKAKDEFIQPKAPKREVYKPQRDYS